MTPIERVAIGTGAAGDPVSTRRSGLVMAFIDCAAEYVLIAALLGELALVLVNIASKHSYLWADEAARLALSILAFIGGAVAYRRRDHAFVRIVISRFPKSVEAAFLALADILVLLAAAMTAYASLDFIASSWNERTPILQLPSALIALPLPIGMALIVVYAALNLWRDRKPAGTAKALVLLLAVGAVAFTSELWLPMLGGDFAITAALIVFLIAILAAVPVGFVLLLATATYLRAADLPLVVLPQTMVNGTGNFILLAIPFFIFAGLIMERGGISERLVNFISTLVGHLRGGLLHVTVASMYIVSGLSGSKPADVAAVGTVMRDKLKERHGAPEGAAVLAAAAVMGETVPPSIAMLIVGSITSVSVAAMFIGGLIPAAVMAICLMILISFRARRDLGPREPRATAGVMVRAGIKALPPLLMPAMLIGGILLGVATPTEVAAFAVAYGLFLGAAIYRRLGLRDFLRTATDTAALTGVLLFIFAASSGFSWTLTVAYLPQRLVELLNSAGNSAAIFMLCSIVLLICVGVLLEGLPSLNVLAPLLIPIAGKVGLNEMHYALVLIISMGIGGFMPLAGVGFYVCCAIMRCDIEAASRAMAPYLAVVVIGLLAVAFIPWFSLFLPRYFGFIS